MSTESKAGPGPTKKPPARKRSVQGIPGLPPGAYFQLVPRGSALVVVKVPSEKVKDAAGTVLTRKQLEALLGHHGIPTVSGSALSGYLNSLHALPGFESHASESFSEEPGRTPLSRSGWRGALGELSAQRGGLIPQQDLNALRNNHPIFDLRDRRGGLNSVKTSVRSDASRGDPFATYLRGLRDVMGLRTETYASARAALYPQLSPDEGEALMMRNGYVSVNADHVEPFREALRNPDNYRRQSYREVADRFLELEPVRMGATVYLRYEMLENTARGTGTPAAVRQQAQAALTSLRERIASRVRSNGITTEHLIHLERFRQQVTAANPQMMPEEVRTWVFPELLLVARHGGGVRGNAGAAGVAGVRGAVGGGIVSVVFEVGQLVYEFGQDQHPDILPSLFKAGVSGSAAGSVGGAVDAIATANMGSALSRRLLAQGLSAPWVGGAGRAVGGLAGGALAAPVFAMTSMAFDGEEHSSTDYVATGGRAFISGGLSAAVAAGAVGAIWGSEVPVLGNAVGFIIGFAGYYVVDALTGDRVEQGIRRSLAEPTTGKR